MHERRMKERITIEVKASVEQKKNELKFLEALIKELEEKHRIELRKKAILKNQCDQAYLRGVAAISQEALKMSHSTLDDFYKGMRMQKYDGQNVLNTLKQLQGTTSQVTTTQTVTMTRTVDGQPVPPINNLSNAIPRQEGQTYAANHTHTNSFEKHIEASKTTQAASRMFNMKDQSFGAV